jgi:uncharacterized protein YjbI with pentapeptide repeats
MILPGPTGVGGRMMTSERLAQEPTCPVGRCSGVQVQPGKPCLAHCDETDLEIALSRLVEQGSLDARGTRFTSTLLAHILDVLPKDAAGRPVFREIARFDGATFQGGADFGETTFKGGALFNGATFEDAALFSGATFEGEAGFGKANFKALVGFDKATFKSGAGFGGTIFEGPTVFGETAFNGAAGFGAATFKSAAIFSETTFADEAIFDDATFERGAGFDKATFKNWAHFERVTFERWAFFNKASFEGWAFFDRATLRGAFFSKVTFKDLAAFYRATLHNALFSEATFEDRAVFREAAFKDSARLDRATFKDEADFGGATFEADADFQAVMFEETRQLGPLLVAGLVSFDEAVAQQRVQIEVSAAVLVCRRTRFLEGVHLRVRWAQIELDGADLAKPSVVSGALTFDGLDECSLTPGWHQRPGPPRPAGRPWIASLRHADVAGLAVADVDLQACWFTGVHNLDRLRLESPKAFTATPGWHAVETGWAWPPACWWTRRQTLAEEHAWRVTFERGIRRVGWHASQTWPISPNHWVAPGQLTRSPAGHWWRHVARIVRDWRHTARRLTLLRALRTAHLQQARETARWRRDRAREIANLYRALRKGREDNKDEPGAADFYYGEMELRRKATPPSVERAILSAYWLVSGYGLRAWRALAAVLIALTLFAMLMVTVGFQQSRPAQLAATGPTGVAAPAQSTPAADTSFVDAMLYGARTAIGLPRTPQPNLTRWGDVLQILLRIIVPVLLGLSVLSIRGRVKR